MDAVRSFDARAVRASADIVDEVKPIHLDLPTPCAGWTLADLLAHMSAQHRGFAAAARGRGNDLQAWWPTEHGRDATAARYRADAEAVIAAFEEIPTATQEFELPDFTPVSRFPAVRAIGFHLVDYVVHGWDVARTLGLAYEPAPDLLAATLPIAAAVPDGDNRLAPGAAFAPGLSVDANVGTLDRILLMLGRSPAWQSA